MLRRIAVFAVVVPVFCLLRFQNMQERFHVNLVDIELQRSALNAIKETSTSAYSKWLVNTFVRSTGSRADLLGSEESHILLNVLGSFLNSIDDVRLVAQRLKPASASPWLLDSAFQHYNNADWSGTQVDLFVFDENSLGSNLTDGDAVRYAEMNARIAESYVLDSGAPYKALPFAEKALQAAPLDCKVLISTSYVFGPLGLGIGEASISSAHRAVELCPSLSNAWLAYGTQMQALGKLDVAEQSLRKALSLGNADVWVSVDLSSLLLQEGQCSEALPYISDAVKKGPDSPWFIYLLAKTSICLGDTDQALSLYHRLQPLDMGYAEKIGSALKPFLSSGGVP